MKVTSNNPTVQVYDKNLLVDQLVETHEVCEANLFIAALNIKGNDLQNLPFLRIMVHGAISLISEQNIA